MAQHSNASSLPIQTILYSQTSILDFLLFPGFTGISTAVQEYVDLNVFAPLVCICGMLMLMGKYAWTWLETYFTSTVHVSCTDEAYDMVIIWVSSQGFSHEARSSLASTDMTSPWGWYGPRRSNALHSDSGSKKNKPLYYVPWNGRFFFWYKGHLLMFRRMQQAKETRSSQQEEVSISCFGTSPKVLKELLGECRSQYLGLVQNKTSVFEHRDESWKRSRARDIRQISTVILDQKVKDDLLEDIEDFLDPRARRWYSNRGIPYRRGYLLYGPPGTGKSSLCLSIAGRFDLDIYILSLSSIDDDCLMELFAELPQQCVVLLEDIDAAGPTRSQDTDVQDSGQILTGFPPKQAKPAQGRVSLSALLNTIDGVASQEGRLLIMTTNHIERLDDALIRPGRVDMKVEFGLADKEMITQLFCVVFKCSEGDAPHLGKRVEDDETVERLAKEFAAKLPKGEFSPAEVLSLLLANKQSARQAVDNVEVWMARIKEEKKEAKN